MLITGLTLWPWCYWWDWAHRHSPHHYSQFVESYSCSSSWYSPYCRQRHYMRYVVQCYCCFLNHLCLWTALLIFLIVFVFANFDTEILLNVALWLKDSVQVRAARPVRLPITVLYTLEGRGRTLLSQVSILGHAHSCIQLTLEAAFTYSRV